MLQAAKQLRFICSQRSAFTAALPVSFCAPATAWPRPIPALRSSVRAEKRKKLERLAARPDREIDLSDIPETRQIPSDAVIGKFDRPKKTSVTIRIDADVLAWLRRSGAGYQTRINDYLGNLMRRNRKR